MNNKNDTEKEMDRSALMLQQYELEYRNRAQCKHIEEAIKQEFIFVNRYGKVEEFSEDNDGDRYHYFSDESDDDLDNPAKFVKRQEALEFDFNNDLDSSDMSNAGGNNDNDEEDLQLPDLTLNRNGRGAISMQSQPRLQRQQENNQVAAQDL